MVERSWWIRFANQNLSYHVYVGAFNALIGYRCRKDGHWKGLEAEGGCFFWSHRFISLPCGSIWLYHIDCDSVMPHNLAVPCRLPRGRVAWSFMTGKVCNVQGYRRMEGMKWLCDWEWIEYAWSLKHDWWHDEASIFIVTWTHPWRWWNYHTIRLTRKPRRAHVRTPKAMVH